MNVSESYDKADGHSRRVGSSVALCCTSFSYVLLLLTTGVSVDKVVGLETFTSQAMPSTSL